MTTILGGGISGLSAAYYLLRQGAFPISIYEAGIRLGGWIRTESHKDKGFIFEQGPRTIRPKGIQGGNTLELIQELQLPVNAIASDHPAARNRMIYAKNALCTLPNNLKGLFKTLPPFKKPLISGIFHDIRAGRKTMKYGDESIYDFVKRRFGEDIADYAISPMICGICAGDAKDISVRFLMNDLFDKEQRYGGVVKGMLFSKFASDTKKVVENDQPGLFKDSNPSLFEQAKREKWSMYSIPNGLEQLPRTLAQYLRENDVNINLSSDCRQIIFTDKGAKMDIKGQNVDTDFIISSIPSFKLATCVKSQHPSLAALLSTIPYVDVAVINLQYPAKNLLKQQAFGFLVPPIERLPILGVIFDSCCFDMNDNTVLTIMMGGKWFNEYFGSAPTQKELLDIALRYVDRILGIDVEPKMSRVHVLQKCIPQYTVGHQKRVADIRRYILNYNLPLAVCGAAYDGVGINDVILSARRQIESLQMQNTVDA